MEDRLKLWMYPNKYAKTDKHPSKTGTGEVSKGFVKTMVDAIKSGSVDLLELECASWEKVSKNGNPYVFVTVKIGDRKTESEEEEVPF